MWQKRKYTESGKNRVPVSKLVIIQELGRIAALVLIQK